MRVLFTTWAWPSHLYAMVPLARAFQAAGHEVLVASQPALRVEIGHCGLPAAVVGTDVDAVGMVRGYVLSSAGAQPRAGRGPRALRMLLANAESMVDDLAELAARWRPDVLVFEPTALAGPIAAAAVGVPAVRHLYGTDLLLRARPLLPELVAPLATRLGVAPPDAFGVSTIDPTPASLQVPGDYERLPMRYDPFNGPGASAAPLPAADRPRVCVTWGHTMARLAPEHFLVGGIAAALAGAGIQVVAAVTAAQRGLVGDVPDGVRIVVDAPLRQVVPHCDAVVAHGGAGTLLTTLRAGLPSLLVPQLPDHAGHAGRLLAAGAGEVLTRDEATPERVVAEVGRLVTDGPHRAAARRLQAEMRAQPAPAEVVGALRRLAARRSAFVADR